MAPKMITVKCSLCGKDVALRLSRYNQAPNVPRYHQKCWSDAKSAKTIKNSKKV